MTNVNILAIDLAKRTFQTCAKALGRRVPPAISGAGLRKASALKFV